MRSIKFYVSVLMITGFILSVNSSSFAKEYSVNVNNIKESARQSIWEGNTDVIWKAKIKNNTDTSQAYTVKIHFLNSASEIIHEADKTAIISPDKAETVAHKLSLKTELVKKINSGYVTINKINEKSDIIEEHTLTAKLNKNMEVDINGFSNHSVELAYSVKLKNNTNKEMTRNVTVAFLDADNNKVKSETRKATFYAGESKLLSDSFVVKASDADKIAKGHVTIN